jgi:hypothetical protein
MGGMACPAQCWDGGRMPFAESPGPPGESAGPGHRVMAQLRLPTLLRMALRRTE